jgi:hypothetical protein
MPRRIFSKYIPWDGLRHLGMTIRLEGVVAAEQGSIRVGAGGP